MKLRGVLAVGVLAVAGFAGTAVPAHAHPPGAIIGYYETKAECLQAGLDQFGEADETWWCANGSATNLPPGGIWALWSIN